MRRSFRWVAVVLCLRSVWCASSQAESFTTNIISGVSTNAGTYFILGDTGSLNYLEINNGGSLVCFYATIGNNPPASNNTALVTGTNSVWTATGGFVIGGDSSGNSLIVSNGGALNSSGQTSYVGDWLGANNNLVLLTGTNSVWVSGSIRIGPYATGGNRLQVLNGAQMLSNTFIALMADSTNNSVIVSGPGSVLADSGSFYMESYGTGNAFVVSSSAEFTCNGATFDGSACAVTITGTNTVWNNSGSLVVGDVSGGTNQLTISAGAVVSNTTVSIGDNPASPNNTVIVDGPGTVWYCHAFYFGSSSNNTLMVTNGATVYSSQIVDIGDGCGANNNTVVVTGTNSIWNNNGSLVVGFHGGSGNQLQIMNSAQMMGNTSILLGTGNSNDSLVVTGPNSLLANSGSFLMESDGPLGNTLVVSAGARFTCNGATIDGNANVAAITGTSTVWSNTGSLLLGYCCGNSNRLVISTGAAVTDGGCTISTSGNSILVDGTGTTWNTGWISIADYTSGNQLVVTNGATVNCLGIQEAIGDAINCQVIITGTNTICNAGTVHVGFEPIGGSFPTALLIKNGGQLLGNLYASIDCYGNPQAAVVTDPGSRWAGISQLVVGVFGDGGHLQVSNNAVVQAGQALVGAANVGGPASNTVTVVNGSTFIVTNNLGSAPLTLLYGEIVLGDGTVIGQNISISNQSEITGCGTIVGNINNGGTLAVNCPGGTLTLVGVVTNNASIVATNGADVEFLGPVVNNGTIDLVNGFGHFLGGFLNKGVYRDAGTVLATPSLSFNAAGMVISFGSVSGKTYAVESTDGMTPTNWAVLFGGITGTGGTMQFADTSAVGMTQRFYRVHLTLP